MSPNANEKWLIQNRLKLENISDNDTICGKHRPKYSIGYKGPNTCCYPKYERKSKDKNAFVVEHLIEINELFSSLGNSVKLPLHSTWCRTCRLCLHPKIMKGMSQDVRNRCLVCCGNHVNVLETPKKKRRCESRSTQMFLNFHLAHHVQHRHWIRMMTLHQIHLQRNHLTNVWAVSQKNKCKVSQEQALKKRKESLRLQNSFRLHQ